MNSQQDPMRATGHEHGDQPEYPWDIPGPSDVADNASGWSEGEEDIP
jgi:hypothetical protein